MKKGFGDLFSSSMDEYKKNFKLFLIFVLIFSVVPSLLLFLVNPEYSNNQFNLTSLSHSNYFVFSLFLLISVLLGFLLNASLIYFALNNKKLSFSETLKGGLSYFWKYTGLTIVLFFFLILLFILLIIPGIIFMIYWQFAFYVLIAERAGILKSLKRSKELVKGRWWKVLGYFILIYLIFIGISWVISLPNTMIQSSVLGFIINSIYNIIYIPFMILFFKNFYLDLKSDKSETKTEQVKVKKKVKKKKK